MARTIADRFLGRCSRRHAAAFGVAAGLAGVLLLREKTNDLTARLGACNIGLYALCYTPLKQVHWLNTWVGAVVGAVPLSWDGPPPETPWNPRRWSSPPRCISGRCPISWRWRGWRATITFRGATARMSPATRHTDVTGRRVAAVAPQRRVHAPHRRRRGRVRAHHLPFAHEAALLVMPMALGAAAFHRKPSVAAARAMFYGSLAYLPAFQATACWRASRASRARRSRWKCACPRARGWERVERGGGWQSWGDEWGETPGTAALGSSMDAVERRAVFRFCRRRRGRNDVRTSPSARRGTERRKEVEEEEETTGDSARRRGRTKASGSKRSPEPTLGRLEPFFRFVFHRV